LKIRRATLADLDTLITIEHSAITAAHWSSEQYRVALTSADGSRLVIVMENSAVRAFLVARRIDKEWEIENIVVLSTERRHGLGTQLISEFLKVVHSGSAQAIFLEVRESNVAARGLYRKCGFLESGRRKNYYDSPREDAILYKLELREFDHRL
jgi:[ribosomal protein S18]-alanine N-acetyltransferase